MKSIILAAVAVILVIAIVMGGRALFNGSAHSTATAVHTAKTTASTAKTASSPSAILPKPPFSCATNVSLVQLSSDYVITNLNCNPPGLTGDVVLSCDGTLFQGSTNLSLNCYRPNYYASSDQVVCSGTTNAGSGPVNLTLNYNCNLSSAATTQVLYSCNGYISGFGSFGISLPMSVSCGA
jgi:hypothetical protein